MPNLYGLFHAMPYGKVLVAISTVAVVCAAWYVIRRLPLIDAIAAMLCAGLLVGMHAFLYDCAFLLPVLLLDAEREGLERVFPAWILAGISTIALARPSIAFIGQAAVVLFFCYLVHGARKRKQHAIPSNIEA